MPCNYARLVDLVFLFLLVVGVNKHRLNSYLGMRLEVAVFLGGDFLPKGLNSCGSVACLPCVMKVKR